MKLGVAPSLAIALAACELRDPPPCAPGAAWPDPCAGEVRVSPASAIRARSVSSSNVEIVGGADGGRKQ